MSTWDIYGRRAKRKVKRFKADATDRANFCPRTYTVEIDSSLNNYDRLQAELHELLHAVLDRLSVTEGKLSHDLEEVIANGVATWLMENRKILLKRLKGLDEPKSPKPATVKPSTETK